MEKILLSELRLFENCPPQSWVKLWHCQISENFVFDTESVFQMKNKQNPKHILTSFKAKEKSSHLTNSTCRTNFILSVKDRIR